MIKKIAVVIGVLLVVFLVVYLIPLKTVAYTVMVDYQDTETYYEDEPYEAIETYTETVPLNYEVVESEGHAEGITAVFSVVVRNEDDITGVFIVDFTVFYGCTFIKPGSIQITNIPFFQKKILYLEPNDIGTATYSIVNPHPVDCDVDSWSYDVTSSTKEVEMERTVTKYREVEKQRTVTKQRPETRYKKVTLLDYWLQ